MWVGINALGTNDRWPLDLDVRARDHALDSWCDNGQGSLPVDFNFKTADLKKLYDYWSKKAGDRPMPARGDLDPIIDIPTLARCLWLVDVEGDPPGFRFRLLGSEVVNRYGADFTGKRLDEVDLGDLNDAIRGEYEEVVASKKPVYARHQIQVQETGTLLPYERILLPLSDDGEAVNMLLGGGYPLEYDAG